MDKTNDLSRSPHAVFGVAVDEHLPATLAADVGGNLGELARFALAFDLERLLCDLVTVQAGGVAPAPQEQRRVRLLGLDDLFFDVVVYGALDGAQKPCSHIDAAGAEAERGSEALSVGETARRNERDLEGLPRPAEEDKVRNI